MCLAGNTDFGRNDLFTRTSQPAPGNKTLGADRIPVNQPVAVKLFQRVCPGDSDFETFVQGQTAALRHNLPKGSRGVPIRFEDTCGVPRNRFGFGSGAWVRRGRGAVGSIRQFHHAIKVTGSLVAADLEHVHLAFMRPGNRFVFPNAGEFALVRSLI